MFMISRLMSAGLPAASPPRISEESLSEANELFVPWMQRPKIGIGRPRGGDLHQDEPGITQRRGVIKQAAEFMRVEATSASKASIFQNGEIELDLGDGFFIRTRR